MPIQRMIIHLEQEIEQLADPKRGKSLYAQNSTLRLSQPVVSTPM